MKTLRVLVDLVRARLGLIPHVCRGCERIRWMRPDTTICRSCRRNWDDVLDAKREAGFWRAMRDAVRRGLS